MRGQRVAVVTGLAALLALGGATIGSRGDLREGWHLIWLRHGSRPARIEAAEALVAMGSRQAIPALIRAIAADPAEVVEESQATFVTFCSRGAPLGEYDETCYAATPLALALRQLSRLDRAAIKQARNEPHLDGRLFTLLGRILDSSQEMRAADR